MQSPTPEFIQELIDEIVGRDFYGVRDYPTDAFDHVLDLGANIGVFSTLARHLWPQAEIRAVEASQEILPFLRENVRHLDVMVVPAPIGDGSWVSGFGRNEVNHGCTIFGTDDPEAEDRCKSVTLADLVEGWDLSRTLIKIDIEGAERLVFNDPAAVEIIGQVKFLTGETHFGPAFVQNNVGWTSFTACDSQIRELFGHMKIDNINRHPRKDTMQEEASGLLKMTTEATPNKTWISRCARCLSDHHVETHKLVGNDDYDQWAMCPKTGQPFFIKSNGKTF